MSSGVSRSRIDCFARYDKRKKLSSKTSLTTINEDMIMSYETSPHSVETGHKMHAEKSNKKMNNEK